MGSIFLHCAESAEAGNATLLFTEQKPSWASQISLYLTQSATVLPDLLKKHIF